MVPSGVPAATRVTPGPAGLVGPAGRVAARPMGARPMAARPLVPRGPAGRVVVAGGPPTRRAASSVQGRLATLRVAVPARLAARAATLQAAIAAIPPAATVATAAMATAEPRRVGPVARARP